MHTSVLVQEVVRALEPKTGQTIVDCTINGGGHTARLIQEAPGISIIGLDADPEAIARAAQRFGATVRLVNENFAHLDHALKSLGVEAVDAFLFDLGWSTDQLEGKGMSFLKNEPLDMTFGKSRGVKVTAKEIVNEWAEESLRDIIHGFGEERYARSIAQNIVEARQNRPITTTGELTDIVVAATPSRYRHGKLHPATRTFQALRIAANDELGALEDGLIRALDHLTKEGRIAVITFHSIEDRIVKRMFRKWADDGKGSLVTKKPIVATESEIAENPRSRSAKLRTFVKS